jgi:hypothetical protein
MAYYMALSQVGMEMAAPIGLGVWGDVSFHTIPWLTIAGAVLGLVGGLTHLIVLANRRNRQGPSQPTRDQP